MLAAGRPIYGCVAEGYWEDVGTTEAYLKAHQDILDERVQVEMSGFPLRPGVWLGKGSTLDPTAEVDGPAIIGDNCRVGPGAVLGEYTTLGANVRIGRRRRGPALGGRRQRLPRGRGPGRRVRASAGPATCARGPAASRGRCSARGCLVGRPRRGPGRA